MLLPLPELVKTGKPGRPVLPKPVIAPTVPGKAIKQASAIPKKDFSKKSPTKVATGDVSVRKVVPGIKRKHHETEK